MGWSRRQHRERGRARVPDAPQVWPSGRCAEPVFRGFYLHPAIAARPRRSGRNAGSGKRDPRRNPGRANPCHPGWPVRTPELTAPGRYPQCAVLHLDKMVW